MLVDQFETRLMIMIAAAESTIFHEEARLEGLKTALQLYRENRKQGGSLPADGSKFGFILQQIKASGNQGLTVAEMMEKATAAGVKVKRNTLRSQLWNRKREGMLLHKDGHYKLAPEFRDDSGEAQETQPPRHRERLRPSEEDGKSETADDDEAPSAASFRERV